MGYKSKMKKEERKRAAKNSSNTQSKNAFDSIAKNAMKSAGMPVAKKGNQKGIIKKLAGVTILLVMLGVWKLVELLIYLVMLCF
jgi:hypothetical protein